MTNKDAILAEIIEYTSPATIAEDEFTINDYRAKLPLPRPTRETVRARLATLVEQGLLESRKVLKDAKWHVAYRRVEEKWGDNAQT